MSLLLSPTVGLDALKPNPKLSYDQRLDVVGLAFSIRILLKRSPSIAHVLQDTLRGVYRSAFHLANPRVCRHIVVDRETREYINAYFPETIHPDFFRGLQDCARIRGYLRVAAQRFDNLEIRATRRLNDFVVLATIPGDDTVLLARIWDNAFVKPSLEEVGLIVLNRRAALRFGWPVLLSIILGAAIDVVLLNHGLDVKEYGAQLIVLCCMLLATGTVWILNKLKDRAFLKRFPRLAPVM